MIYPIGSFYVQTFEDTAFINIFTKDNYPNNIVVSQVDECIINFAKYVTVGRGCSAITTITDCNEVHSACKGFCGSEANAQLKTVNCKKVLRMEPVRAAIQPVIDMNPKWEVKCKSDFPDEVIFS
jgi:hypothetical protein